MPALVAGIHVLSSGTSKTPRAGTSGAKTPLRVFRAVMTTGRGSKTPGQISEVLCFPGFRSPMLTIFWHCGFRGFSFRTRPGVWSRQPTVNGFDRGFSLHEGSGNADSQRKVRSSGWCGPGRACDSGCDPAHPPSWRASASYRPLRAVWAVCAWALRGCEIAPRNPSALTGNSAPT